MAQKPPFMMGGKRPMAPPVRPGSAPPPRSSPPPSFGRSAAPPPKNRAAITDPAADDGGGDDAGKVPRSQAHLIMADEHCQDCKNFLGDSCKKIMGPFSPDDACVKYFERGSPGGEQEPDEDDQPGYGGGFGQDDNT